MRDHWGSNSVSNQQRDGHQVESEVRDRFRTSLAGPPREGGGPALGQRLSWRAQGTDWGLRPVGLQSPHGRPPLALVQALREQGTSPSCLSLRPKSNGCLSVTVCATWSPPFGRPEETEGRLGWLPGSLKSVRPGLPHLGGLRRRRAGWAGCLAPSSLCDLVSPIWAA